MIDGGRAVVMTDKSMNYQGNRQLVYTLKFVVALSPPGVVRRWWLL